MSRPAPMSLGDIRRYLRSQYVHVATDHPLPAQRMNIHSRPWQTFIYFGLAAFVSGYVITIILGILNGLR